MSVNILKRRYFYATFRYFDFDNNLSIITFKELYIITDNIISINNITITFIVGNVI